MTATVPMLYWENKNGGLVSRKGERNKYRNEFPVCALGKDHIILCGD